MKNILVISSTLGYDDVRITKEVVSLRDHGYTVTVIGRQTGDEDKLEKTQKNGITYFTLYQKQNLSNGLLVNYLSNSWIYMNSFIIYLIIETLNIISGIRLSKNKANKILHHLFIHQIYEVNLLQVLGKLNLEIDLVHGHDLFSLAAAHRVSVNYQVPLIYDAHEFYSNYKTDQYAHDRVRAKFSQRVYLKNYAYVITVSDAIGKLIMKSYSPKGVYMIYNSPYKKVSNFPSTIRKDIGILKDVPLIIYVGKFGYDHQQGNKILIDMLEFYKEAHFATVGPRNEEHDLETKKRANELGVEKRVHFLDKVPIESVVEYISDSDAGVVLFQSDVLNHILCLGNKFFEMGFANVPVIYRSGLTEIDRIAKEYNFGFELSDQTASGLANSLRKIHNDPNRFKMTNKKHKEFKETFSWENQEKNLNDIYKKLLPQ